MAWTNPRAPRYPKQLVGQFSTEVADTIERIALEKELPKAEVLRVLVHAGLRKAGYRLATTDRRTPSLDELAADPDDKRPGPAASA